MTEHNKLLDLCIEAAQRGRQVVIEWLENPDMTRTNKTTTDILSIKQLDERAQQAAAEFLQQSQLGEYLDIRGEDLPKPIIGKNAKYKILLDIADGTQEVVSENGNWTGLVSVFDDSGILLCVCVFASPHINFAMRGKGAYTKALSPQSSPIKLPMSHGYERFTTITTSLPWEERLRLKTLQVMTAFAPRSDVSFRMFGSTGYELAAVANGTRSACFQVETKPWELPISLLVQEAGGQVWSQKLDNENYAMVASIDPDIHGPLVAAVKKVTQST